MGRRKWSRVFLIGTLCVLVGGFALSQVCGVDVYAGKASVLFHPTEISLFWAEKYGATFRDLGPDPGPVWRVDVNGVPSEMRQHYFTRGKSWRLPRAGSYGELHWLDLPWWILGVVWLALAVPTWWVLRRTGKQAAGFPVQVVPEEKDAGV